MVCRSLMAASSLSGVRPIDLATRPVTEIVEQIIAQLSPNNVFDRSRRFESPNVT
jgi:hypothetical protein